ncbi:GDSL-type esterase/lipase family protein [Coprobacter tertius]|uniref:GDSL-type esterase/lipase family protein n=1 Tax=Coprobacter tertius TaxID=2944915 RepID=A0ABT1MHJ9_9BACT|nr:GDSL-type esterase/lipase family protein [Coprobacter tertius]MCP9611849.1 GDSL-type esterase/lipase family protein [Coprobacter tertius]
MKKYIFILLGCVLAFPLIAQGRKYSTFYQQRVTLFEALPITADDIVFIGNSIINGCEWSELFDNKRIKNRGISGDVCLGVYDRLMPVLKGKPSKIFILIGTNDLSKGVSSDTIVYRIGMIVGKIKEESPSTVIYLQSILPVNDCYGMFKDHTAHWKDVKLINDRLKQLTEKEGIRYIDLYSFFVEENSEKMNPAYTNDGLHLLGKGYLLWRDIIMPYVLEE